MSIPINANMDKAGGKLLPNASSQPLKVLLVHDSQMLVNENRLGGGIQSLPVPFVGRMVGFESQSYVGLYHLDETDANATRTRIDWSTDSWSNGDDTVQQGWGNQIAFSADVANFYDMFRMAFTAGNYADGYDMEARWRFGMGVYDASDSPNRINLVEYRRDGSGDVFGIGERFGLAGDTDMNGDDVLFTGSGAIHICDMAVRAPAASGLGDPANAPTTRLGLRAEAVSSNENGDSHKLVFFFGHESPSGKAFPSTGLFVANAGDSGRSAYDHTQQAQSVKNSMAEAVGGFDLVIIMLGHNNDASGTYKSNIETLITQYTSAHTGGGYDTPKFCLVAPWRSDNGAPSWTESKVQDLYDIAIAGDHPFASQWHAYGSVNPHGRTEQLDGTSTTYELDGSDPDPARLHPNNIATAEAMIQDIFWQMQEENWAPEPSASLTPTRGRGRARDRGRIAMRG